MKVTIYTIDGRTYVDVVDLIRAVEKLGDNIATKDLLNRLWSLTQKMNGCITVRLLVVPTNQKLNKSVTSTTSTDKPKNTRVVRVRT